MDGARGLQRELVIGRIDFQQGLAGFDRVSGVHESLGDLSRDTKPQLALSAGADDSGVVPCLIRRVARRVDFHHLNHLRCVGGRVRIALTAAEHGDAPDGAERDQGATAKQPTHFPGVGGFVGAGRSAGVHTSDLLSVTVGFGSCRGRFPQPPPTARMMASDCSWRRTTRRSFHLHDDLPLGPAFFEVGQGLLRLIEWKYPVDHRPDFACLKKFADFRELPAVGMHKEE